MKIKPYISIIKNSIMAEMAYRGHFYFNLAGTLIYLVVSWFLWKAIYVNGGTIRGLTFSSAYLYIGISMSISSIMSVNIDWVLNRAVSSGDILRFLTKPIDFASQLLAESIGESFISCIFIAIPTILLVFISVAQGMPSIFNISIFIVSIILSFILNFFFDFLTGLTVFLTQSINGLIMTKNAIIKFLSGAVIPLAFFPDNIRNILDWLPFQALYNTPVRLLIGDIQSTQDIIIMFMKQAGWILIFYILFKIFFNAALKKLIVNGG
jgi:ABC-2 type transport system permease protein